MFHVYHETWITSVILRSSLTLPKLLFHSCEAATSHFLISCLSNLVPCVLLERMDEPTAAFVAALPIIRGLSPPSKTGTLKFGGTPNSVQDRQRGSAKPYSLPIRTRVTGIASEKLQTKACQSSYTNSKYISVPAERVRNISIIAHIDHGKSTLADRLLEVTGTVSKRDMREQFMDSNEIERDRGITIKLNAVRMNYTYPKDGLNYAIHLIDTPGHVDFSFEVSRSLEACEGALLVVDASQGVEAQTLANVYLALDANLEIIPVLNKIDLPGAEPDRVVREVEEVIGLDCSNAIMASAKAGIGVDKILEGIIEHIPPPSDNFDSPLRALIFDSYYDTYRGVVVYFRVVDGSIKTGDKIKFMVTGNEFIAEEIGVMTPDQQQVNILRSGEIGYIIAGIKTVEEARVGDTITSSVRGAKEPLPGYQEAKPMIFAGLFPVDSEQYNHLKDSLEKLKLNDAALQFEVENSAAMGFGFRCGFLGLLHMDIVQERLEREYDLEIITTAPSVVYGVKPTKGPEFFVDNPADLPEPNKREYISEPYCRLEIITPEEYVGTVSSSRHGQ